MIKFKECKKPTENKKSDDKKDNKTLPRIIIIVASVVLVLSLLYIGKYYWDAYNNRRLNADIKKITTSSQQISSQPENKDKHNLTELISKNSETKAWLTIPGTNIDYPVLQSKDNSKYLTTDFNGNNNKDGSIFMDFRNSLDPLSQNLILYGHNMKDGQMFGELEKFERKDGTNDYLSFVNKNQLIKLDTLDGEKVYKIFAVFVTDSNKDLKGALYYLYTEFSSDNDFNTFIKDVNARSFIKSDIEVVPSDKLITLSTCDYNYPSKKDDHARLVVMGRLLRDGESDSATEFKKNPNVTFPDFYYSAWKK